MIFHSPTVSRLAWLAWLGHSHDFLKLTLSEHGQKDYCPRGITISKVLDSSLLVKSSCEFKAIHLKHHLRQGLWSCNRWLQRSDRSVSSSINVSYTVSCIKLHQVSYTFHVWRKRNAFQEIEPSACRILRALPKFFWPRKHIFPKSSARKPSQASTFKGPRTVRCPCPWVMKFHSFVFSNEGCTTHLNLHCLDK